MNGAGTSVDIDMMWGNEEMITHLGIKLWQYAHKVGSFDKVIITTLSLSIPTTFMTTFKISANSVCFILNTV